jgi:hypothetical protein
MPIQYRIDQATRTIYTRCYGPVTLAEVIDHFRELAADPECPSYLDVMLEWTDTSIVPLSRELREVARHIALLRDRVRFGAFAVVAGKTVLFGMSRMFLVFADGLFDETAVFRTAAEAEVWLSARHGKTQSAV